MRSTSSPFGRGLMQFLEQLRDNNNPRWFKANKERYEQDVREPALQFIRLMEPQLRRISPHLLARDRKVGGSLMRIHRDTRFSKDKTPYKSNLGIQFRHEQGKDVHAPGLYFHVDPDSVFLGAGMWHPDPDALAAVRASIDERSKVWKRTRDSKRFVEIWQLAGESLKRAPRGYTEDHPMIDDLKRKDHIAICSMSRGDVTAPDLVESVAARFRRARAYMAFQADALGLPF